MCELKTLIFWKFEKLRFFSKIKFVSIRIRIRIFFEYMVWNSDIFDISNVFLIFEKRIFVCIRLLSPELRSLQHTMANFYREFPQLRCSELLLKMRLAGLHLQLKRVAREQNTMLAVNSQAQWGSVWVWVCMSQNLRNLGANFQL